MSEMTSSSGQPEKTNKRPTKLLTDFSIETLIGHQQESPTQSVKQISFSIKRPLSRQHQLQPSSCETTPSKCAIDQQESTKCPSSNCAKMKIKTNHVSGCNSNFNSGNPNRKYRPKNFQCSACKMAFSNNGQLKNHVRIHTGERPFRCNHQNCNKTFTRNEELTRHKLIHTGIRPHACTTCGKRFGRKDHLKKHIRTHERKRTRRKTLIHAHRISYAPDEDKFVPPKPTSNVLASQMSHLRDSRLISVAPTIAASNMSLITDPTKSVRPPPSPGNMFVPNIRHQTNATTAAIQQITSDYWSEWYNLIGFYRHQHIAPLNRFSEPFRKN